MARRVALTRSYIIALVATSAMVIAGASFVDGALRDLRADGPLLNIVGRQRMLTQSVAKNALLILTSPSDSVRTIA